MAARKEISEAAAALGRLSAGRPKGYSEAEIARRTARLADARRKLADKRAQRKK